MAVREEILQSISKGTMNPRILGTFFDEMKIKSYKYDYRMQKELVNLFQTKVDVNSMQSIMMQGVFSDYPVYDRVLECNIEHPFIIAGQRERYKRSSVFRKYIDIDTVVANRAFFQYNILVFGGGKLLLNYKLKAYNDKISLVFKEKDFDKSIDTLRVIYLPDSIISYIEPELSMFTGNILDATEFTNFKMFRAIGSYVGFWINKETGDTFMIPDIAFDSKQFTFTINDLLPTNVEKFKLAMVGINTLQEIKDIQPDTEWLRLGIDKMPLPTENVILFRYDNGFFVPSIGDESLEGYYPDMFKVNNPNNKNLRMFILYEDNTPNEHITFDNEATYYLERNNLLEQYKTDTVPTVLKNFEPVDWKYSIDDFIQKYQYAKIDFRDIWDSLEYNIDTINGMLKKWFYLFREYEDATYGFRKGWYHRLATYDNLKDKERINTFAEFPETPELQVEFNSVQYLFTYVDDMETGNVNSFCFFVDGKLTIPTRIIVYRGIQYVYFPKAIFKPDSVIEVERFDGNYFSYNMNLNESDAITMSKLMTKSTVANNIFLVSPTTGEYLNNGQVKTYIMDPVLGEYEVDLQTSVFIVYPESRLRIERINYIEESIMICCNDITYRFFVRESGDDFLWNREELINLNSSGNINHVKQGLLHRLRIHTNDGRLIPKRGYNVLLHKNYRDPVKFNIPISYGTNENFLVSYIGYDETLVYHKTDIDGDGILDLEGRLNRPFSLIYHDIYLDGFRLTKYDIEQIAPFTISVNKAIEKYNTTGNIEIYEKTLPDEDMHRYEWGEKSEFLADKLYEPENEEYINQISEDNPTRICTGDVRNVDYIRDWFYSFVREQLMFHYMNGDDRRDYEAYHLLFDLHIGRLLLNADDRIRYIRTVRETWYLSKDRTIELYKDENGNINYPEPELKELSESSVEVDLSIKMSEEEYAKYGFMTDKFNRVYDEDHSKYVKNFTPTNGYQDAVFYQKYFTYDYDRFPHIEFDGRYVNNLPSEPILQLEELSSSNYKMRDIYPYYYENMPVVPEEDVDSWNTLEMSDWSELYQGCKKLVQLPTIKLKGSIILNNVCSNCESLETIPDLKSYTSHATEWNYAFDGCKKLTNEAVKNFNFDSITTAIAMFRGCSNINHIIKLNYSNITSMISMYADSGITDTEVTIDISGIEESNQLANMFKGTNVRIVHLINAREEFNIDKNEISDNIDLLTID